MRRLMDRVRSRLRPQHGFQGVFGDFEEALRNSPRHVPTGYDVPETADYYGDRLDRVLHDDYPALFWLARAFDGAPGRCRLVEIGGHVGLAYYGFEKHVAYPEGLEWVIVDVPSVTAAGQRLAQSRGRTNLSFANDLSEVSQGVDILFAAGSLQYVPPPAFPERVRAMVPLPAHILINKTPVTEGDTFVTLQDIGVAHCAYRVCSRRDLVDPLVAAGYELVAEWKKERRLEIPGHKDRSIDHYSGFYLRLKD
jgi:putative methyltransferase (TIGR04325 family)